MSWEGGPPRPTGAGDLATFLADGAARAADNAGAETSLRGGRRARRPSIAETLAEMMEQQAVAREASEDDGGAVRSVRSGRRPSRPSVNLAKTLADMMEQQAAARKAPEDDANADRSVRSGRRPSRPSVNLMETLADMMEQQASKLEDAPCAQAELHRNVSEPLPEARSPWGTDRSPLSEVKPASRPARPDCDDAPRPGRSTSAVAMDSVRSAGRGCTAQHMLAVAIRSSAFDLVIIVVVMFHLVLITIDTDARAEQAGQTGRLLPPAWVTHSMDVCMGVYFVELILRIAVERRKFFSGLLNIADFVTVLFGVLEFLLLQIGASTGGIGILSLARLFRLVRLTRVLRLLSGSTELKKLVNLMAGCFKTLFWSFMLVLLVMTVWSIIAVELINPYMQELSRQGQWPECARCRRAFSSVFSANITLFQTIVAGDSWGLIAVPVIEAYPQMAIVFTASLMTLTFGVLNLIVAVIVDAAAERRAKDVHARAREMEDEEAEEKRALGRIFKDIDVDGNETLSYGELLAGAKKVREFASWLRVLDVDNDDLLQIFQIVDEDGSGEIDLQEFINTMYRMKHTEAKSAMKVIKHMVARIDERQEETAQDMEAKLRRLENCLKQSLMGQVQPLVFPAEDGPAVQTEALRASVQELEAEFQRKLREQSEIIRSAFDEALRRASEVAREALEDARPLAAGLAEPEAGARIPGEPPLLASREESGRPVEVPFAACGGPRGEPTAPLKGPRWEGCGGPPPPPMQEALWRS